MYFWGKLISDMFIYRTERLVLPLMWVNIPLWLFWQLPVVALVSQVVVMSFYRFLTIQPLLLHPGSSIHGLMKSLHTLLVEFKHTMVLDSAAQKVSCPLTFRLHL